jgi:hypothetical protein
MVRQLFDLWEGILLFGWCFDDEDPLPTLQVCVRRVCVRARGRSISATEKTAFGFAEC